MLFRSDAADEGGSDLIDKPLTILGDPGDAAAGPVVVQRLRHTAPQATVVVYTALGSEEHAVAAFRYGAADYLRKDPHDLTQLPVVVRTAVGKALLATTDVAPLRRSSSGPASGAICGPWTTRRLMPRGTRVLREGALASSSPVRTDPRSTATGNCAAEALHPASTVDQCRQGMKKGTGVDRALCDLQGIRPRASSRRRSSWRTPRRPR